MGSFNETCSISNMILTNQKTSILLLIPHEYLLDELRDSKFNVCGEGGAAMPFFAPFAFPIHGYISDYGSLEDIVRDDNVLMLEKFFNVDVETILQPKCELIDDGTIHNFQILTQLYQTYIRTEVLEYLEKDSEYFEIDNHLEATLKGWLTYIPSGYDYIHNILKEKSDIFKSDVFKDYIIRQYSFICNLSRNGLNKFLMPSNSGSQNQNWSYLYNFNSFVQNLLVEDITENIIYDLEYYYNEDTERLEGEDLDNNYPNLNESIKNKITEKIQNEKAK